jgi:hypothetical protein
LPKEGARRDSSPNNGFFPPSSPNSVKIMKKNLLAQATLVAATSAALLLPQAQANEISAVTDPVGVVTVSIKPGLNSIAFTLLNEPVASTTVVSSVGNEIQVSSNLNFSEILNANKSYYVEVVNGDFEGERFDVDVPATRSGNGQIFINVDSPHNTTAIDQNSIPASRILVRPHLYLGEINQFFDPPLVGNNNAGLADQVLYQTPVTGIIQTYYLRGNGSEWRALGAPLSANNVVIPPNAGIILRKLNNETEFAITGAVRNNDFAFPFKSGLSLVSLGWPISASPNSLGALGENGWVGNNNSSLADQILVLDPELGTLTTYYLRGDGVNWRALGNPTNVSNNPIIPPTASFFVRKTHEDSNYIFVNPITKETLNN